MKNLKPNPTYEFPKYEITQIILKAQISQKLKLSTTVTKCNFTQQIIGIKHLPEIYDQEKRCYCTSCSLFEDKEWPR